jgi:hypothetical protein
MRNITGDHRSRESRSSKYLAILGMSRANLLLESAAIAETAWCRSKIRVRRTTSRSSENSNLSKLNT